MLKRKIVILLVNYNSAEDTKACLQCIENDKSVESYTIVVDNSQPNDFQLKQYIENLSYATFIETEENLGFSRANNLGIDWANAHIEYEYLFILNNDTEFKPNTLSTLIKPFDVDSNIGATTCRIMYYENQSIVWYGGGEINYRKGWPVVTDLNQTAKANGANLSRFVHYVSGCAIMIKKEVLKELKGFESSFFMYVEDLELSLRMKKNNIKIWYTAEAEILHKVQGSFTDQNDYRGLHHLNNNIGFHFYHKKINQYKTFRKHLKGWSLFVFLFNYWFFFHLKFFKLLILSPKRLDVYKAGIRVIKSILFGK